MNQLEATVISNPGEPMRAAVRGGAVVIFALRLGLGEWEPLYAAVNGSLRVALPQDFRWTLEAIGALEAAFARP